MKIVLLVCILGCAHVYADSNDAVSKIMNQEETETEEEMELDQKEYMRKRTELRMKIEEADERDEMLNDNLVRANGERSSAAEKANVFTSKAEDQARLAETAASEVEKLKKDLSELSAKNTKTMAEYGLTIQTCASVIESLSAGTFIQTQTDLSMLPGKVQALLQQEPEKGGYETSDATKDIVQMIQGVMDDTRDRKFQDQIKFNKESAGIKSEMQVQTNAKEAAEAAGSRFSVNAGDQKANEGQAAKDVAEYEAAIKDNQMERQNLQSNLDKATEQFRMESKENEHYLRQIEEAETQLEGGQARKAHRVVQEQHKADQSFIQLTSPEDIRGRVSSLLQDAGARLNSKSLHLAAMRVAFAELSAGKGGPLDKIINIVADKIQELVDEQRAEELQNQKCKQWDKRLSGKDAYLAEQKDKLQANIESAQASQNQRIEDSKENDELMEELAETQAKDTDDYNAAAKRLNKRIDVATERKGLLGAAKETLPAEATKIHQLIDDLAGNLGQRVKELHNMLSKESSLLDDSTKKTQVSMAGAESKKKSLATRIKRDGAKIVEQKKDYAVTISEIANLGEQQTLYQDECVNTAESHEERMQKLKSEVDALNDARDLLRQNEKNVNEF